MNDIPHNVEFVISCDLETTGTDVHGSEWITGSFGKLDARTLETIDELELKSRPEYWGEQAEEARRTHRISKHTAAQYPDRVESLNKLIDWLPLKKDFVFCCHASSSHKSANLNWQRVFHHFDFAILKNDFLNQDRYFDFYKYFNEQTIISTTQICREYYGHDKKLLLPENCALLGIDFDGNHHEARTDRIACENILRKYKNESDFFNVRERNPKLNIAISEIQENSGLEEQQRFDV